MHLKLCWEDWFEQSGKTVAQIVDIDADEVVVDLLVLAYV